MLDLAHVSSIIDEDKEGTPMAARRADHLQPTTAVLCPRAGSAAQARETTLLLDGMLFPHSSIYSHDLRDLTRSASLGSSFGSFTVIGAVGEAAIECGCRISQETATADPSRLKRGVAEIEVPGADTALIAQEMSEIGLVWATKLDQRGKPGVQILDGFEEALH
jgi:hypothetical protein